jgi:hypothetical protein
MSTAYERADDVRYTYYGDGAAVDVSILPGLKIDFGAIWSGL